MTIMVKNPIQIAISGALGRMGIQLVKEIIQRKDVSLKIALVNKENIFIGKDIGDILNIKKTGVLISDCIENDVDKFDILIDFSNPKGTLKYLDFCLKKKKKMIIGTTGFTESEKNIIEIASKKIGILCSANFSIGVHIMLKLLELTTKIIGHSSDIEIIEQHHRNKIDAPSGTAITMGETISNIMKWKLKDHAIYTRYKKNEKRKQNQIGFSSIRISDVIGEHKVIFGQIGEKIEITHKATSRESFTKGAIAAAKWLISKKAGGTLRKPAILVLKDGTTFYGQSVGVQGVTVGEVVFNTSMTGYQEILTDPSYSQQIITFTYPHIGNVGININDEESNKIYAKGIIIRDFSIISNNYRSEQNLSTYLKKNNIIAISEIDTRKLTRILRLYGSQNGCIMTYPKIDHILGLQLANKFSDLQGIDLVKKITTKKIYSWNAKNREINKQKNHSNFHIIVYDFGVKKNILRMLINRNCHLTIVPAQTKAEDVLKLSPDGIFLSNGPGDPRPCDYAIHATKLFLKKNIPIFGICLGYQLLALSSGARITKMKFGHHGGNHPVKEIKSNRVIITSQNHNFSVDDSSVSKNIEITHRSLFDGSLQGIKRTDKLAFGFQGHPEASPGPHDGTILFDYFINLIKKSKC